MRCRRARKLISIRIDRALPGGDEPALDIHLAECAECRGVAERLLRAWHALGALDEAVTAPDDWAAIERAVEARSGRWMLGWLPGRFGTIPAAAAWAFVGMVALGVAGGTLVSRAALAPKSPESIETSVFAETLGDLPWGSPAAGIGRVLETRSVQETNP